MNYEAWREQDAQRRALREPLLRGIDRLHRTTPRAAAEAEFLRSIGTPERKIGPVRDDLPEPPTS